MRTITKNNAGPDCLTRQPCGLDWGSFSATPCYNMVADSLRTEQCFLCCYCESRIDRDDSHVEHLVPRSKDPGLTYTYDNLASSCNGGTGVDRHCGHKKGGDFDPHRFVSPDDGMAGELFKYLTDGSIQPANHVKRAEYMLSLLALDCPSLTGRRRAWARQIVDTLGPSPTPEMIAWLRSYYLEADQHGRLREFQSLSRDILHPPTR